MQAARMTGTLNITLPIGENGNGATYTREAVCRMAERIDTGLPILFRQGANQPIVIGSTTKAYCSLSGKDCIGISVDVAFFSGGTEEQITESDENGAITSGFISTIGLCPFGG